MTGEVAGGSVEVGVERFTGARTGVVFKPLSVVCRAWACSSSSSAAVSMQSRHHGTLETCCNLDVN